MSERDNKVVPIRGPIVAEWDIKMRMVFTMRGDKPFEFDLPDMSMTPNYVEDMVAAFREAVEARVNGKGPSEPLQ